MNKGIIVLALIAVAFVVWIAYDQGYWSPFQARDDGPSDGNGDGDGNENDGYSPPTPPSSDGKKPTSMTAMVSPNPVNMRGAIYGTLVTDGYNYSPVYNHAEHKGSGESTVIAGTIGPDGKWELVTQLNTPGYWEFWATCDGLSSNIVDLTCQGVLVVIDLEHWSKTLGPDSTEVEVYSNYKGNCGIFASQDGWASETYITNTVINAGGYGICSVNFDSLANGNWEFDARVAGHTARGWGGTDWVGVGR